MEVAETLQQQRLMWLLSWPLIMAPNNVAM
jgi:hypothetical protein